MVARDGMTLPWDSLAELVSEASELVLAAPYIKEGRFPIYCLWPARLPR